MNRYLKIELAMTDGTKKTVSIRNPASGLDADTIDAWVDFCKDNNIFFAEMPGYGINIVGWVSAYYEENVITEIV